MQKQGWWGYVFTLPFVFNILVFFMFPFIFSLYLTFTKWDLFNSPEWVSLTNWINLLNEDRFWLSVRNIFYFAIVYVPLKTVVALVFAQLLNQQIKGKSFFRTLYFLPVVTPWIAGGLVWYWLYNHEFGIINLFLEKVGLDKVDWLNHEDWWVVIGAIAIANVWKGAGHSMILLLAGLQGVSADMIEAARMDGANGWKIFIKITVPIVSPMVYLVMVLSTIGAFHTFDVFYVMIGTGGAIADRNNIPNMLIYMDAFQNFKMGSASAMAWMMFIIILAVTLIQRKLEKRWVHYE